MSDSQYEAMALLEKAQAVIEVEKSLTATLEKVEPWLRHAKPSHHTARVRPIPSNMEEAVSILSVARNLASRTSAPAGWNPAAPLVGFSTPNPLPNQLRGGALATLQLERAKQAETVKKRQKLEQQKAAQAKQHQHEEKEHEVTQPQQQHPQQPRTAAVANVPQQQLRVRPKQEVSMNLSESSSSDDDDDEMEED
jgi:hypothetical protein